MTPQTHPALAARESHRRATITRENGSCSTQFFGALEWLCFGLGAVLAVALAWVAM